MLRLLSLPLAALVVLGLWSSALADAPPVPAASIASATDSIEAERDRYMMEVLRQIEGREDQPAGEVFENVEVFADVPAGRLPRIMNMGFGRSLGVSCAHCHVPGDWAAEDSTAKSVARDMVRMVGAINGDLLPAIGGLRGERPAVNCTTCHRGAVVPALDLPPSAG